MPALFDTVKAYLKLIEICATDRAAYTQVLHPEVEQTEFPNLYNKTLVRRDFDSMVASVRDTREIVASQQLTIQHITECAEDTILVECLWEGEMAIETNRVRRGQVLTGHLSMIFELRDGKIYRLRNYICYNLF